MKRVLVVLFLTAVAAIMALPAAHAGPKYVGVKACGKCHKKVKQGEQLKIWQESDHAKAFETLGGDKAKEKAKELGVAGSPQKAEACLICHTTGFGEPAGQFKKGFKMEQGVQCEACHGAGEKYKKKKIMKAIWKESGKDNKGDSPTAKKTGLIFPNEKTCTTCHAPERTFKGKTYKNPSYKEFDFKKRHEKMKHPVPS